jgi:hypothetical protein
MRNLQKKGAELAPETSKGVHPAKQVCFWGPFAPQIGGCHFFGPCEYFQGKSFKAYGQAQNYRSDFKDFAGCASYSPPNPPERKLDKFRKPTFSTTCC